MSNAWSVCWRSNALGLAFIHVTRDQGVEGCHLESLVKIAVSPPVHHFPIWHDDWREALDIAAPLMCPYVHQSIQQQQRLSEDTRGVILHFTSDKNLA